MAQATKQGRYYTVDGKQWKESDAKELLIVDLKTGKVKPGDKPQAVQNTKDEYLKWPAHLFRNNYNNLLKKYQAGESPFDTKDFGTPSGSKAGKAEEREEKKEDDLNMGDLSQGGGGGGGGDEGGGDADMSFHSIPDEITFSSLQGKAVKFPMLQMSWEDQYGRPRITIIVHLPAGLYRKNCVKYKVRGEEQKFMLMFDWGNYRVLDPDSYGKAFKDSSGHPLYSAGDSKIVAYRRKVRTLKGSTMHSSVESVMTIDLDSEVTNRVTNVEGYPGFQILKMGDPKNPQVFCHIELMGVAHGHYTPSVKECNDYCSSDSDY